MIKINTLPGYEDVLDNYYVTEDGDVYSDFIKKSLSPSDNGRGYLLVSLKLKNIRKWKKAYIHRLVALAYIDNLEDKKEVNHIDEDKHNNHKTNLEWVTRIENINHGTGIERQIKKRTEVIYVYDYLLKFIGKYNGMNEATTQVLGYSQNRGRNGRIEDYFFLTDKLDIRKIISIAEESAYKPVVVEDTITGEKKYFPKNRDARRFFDNKVNVTDAIKYDWLVRKRYKIYNLNYKALL